jgi:hypothetical protein
MTKINKNIELISLIYKSVDYLKMIHKELISKKNDVPGWSINYRIVANDANESVLNYLRDHKINHSVYRDSKPEDFYLNRVYRCWNYGALTSKYDNICFVNSDMVFSDGWLEKLLRYHDGNFIPCSRLIESGKMPSGLHGVSKSFGNHPTNIDFISWNEWAMKNKESRAFGGGLYMPCVFETKKFIQAGGYPEGNVFRNGKSIEIGHPNDRSVYKSGDTFFFEKMENDFGLKHITVFDSLVYHIQEGEMDAPQ